MVDTEKKAEKNKEPNSVAFIHNVLDDFGLDPYEWRIYTHIVRRTGGKPDKVFFASFNKTAKVCKMSVRKAQQATKVLVEANLITKKTRSGRTDEYRVTLPEEWVDKDKLDEIRKASKGGKSSEKVSDVEAEED